MKRLFFCIVLIGALYAAHSVLPGQAYLKGTVTHILENFDDENEAVDQVKVRVRDPGNLQKEFVIITQPPGRRLQAGDRILLRRAENTAYGINSSVEAVPVFFDFAREGGVVWIFVLLGLSLLLVNRKNWRYLAALAGNILLLCLVLPLWLDYRLPPAAVTLVFCLFNTAAGYYLLPSRKFIPAAFSALLGAGGSGLFYAGLIRRYHLEPFVFLQTSLGKFFDFPKYLDAHLLVMMSFYLCLFTVIFLLKVSYRDTIYENIRFFFFRILQLFGFLAAGLLLPFLLFFRLSNLELNYLLNYQPFVYLFCKLFLCLLAVQISCIIYLVYYYNQNKSAFARHAALRELKTAPADKLVALQKILQEQRLAEIKTPQKRRRKKK